MKPQESREIADRLNAYKMKQIEAGTNRKEIFAFEDKVIKLYEKKDYSGCLAILKEAETQ